MLSASSRLLVIGRGWRHTRTFGQVSLQAKGTLQPASPVKVQWCQESTQPVPAARLPYRVKLTAGKRYAWCACGHSQKQPFCDGAHRTRAPGISPVRFTPERSATATLCACKRTQNPPYCDGSHFRLIFQDLVTSLKRVFK